MKIENIIKKPIKKKNIFNILSFLFVFIIFLIDRLVKTKIVQHQLDDGNVIFINNFLNFDLVWNSGIGFGLLNLDAGILYHSISIFIFAIVMFIGFIIVKSTNADKLLFSMIMGGAIGNLYDRAIYYAVPDFIDIHINNYHWFTFNIADIFISTGIILLIVKELFSKKNEKI